MCLQALKQREKGSLLYTTRNTASCPSDSNSSWELIGERKQALQVDCLSICREEAEKSLSSLLCLQVFKEEVDPLVENRVRDTSPNIKNRLHYFFLLSDVWRMKLVTASPHR
jgi:hypothetical protein